MLNIANRTSRFHLDSWDSIPLCARWSSWHWERTIDSVNMRCLHIWALENRRKQVSGLHEIESGSFSKISITWWCYNGKAIMFTKRSCYRDRRLIRSERCLPLWGWVRGAAIIVVHVVYILHLWRFPLARVELNPLSGARIKLRYWKRQRLYCYTNRNWAIPEKFFLKFLSL